ncbi:MAG: hypothetical protein B6229_07405 [Spirochaetaceae bacterium 4572_7]|nr:MAG: hypothetical protein B6229_07405 [Spirochaetaceae bacterium 4572_7]
MDTKYIEPFVEATINIFKEFYDETPDMKTPFIFNKDENMGWDLSAVKLTEKLVGYPIESIDDDVIDSTGEVVNIIAGNAKKGLEEFRLVISLPSIVQGENHQISWPSNSMPIITIPFVISMGTFHLSVGLENIIK